MTRDAEARWRLTQKRALVTGASRGIGLAIARELMDRGAAVRIVARDQDALDAAVEGLRSGGGDVAGIAADVATSEGREVVLRAVTAEWDRLDILVNNAGTNIRKRTLEYTDDEVDTLFELNLMSAFHLTRALHPLLATAGSASVVNMGSVAGHTALRTGAPYAMTKAALAHLTRYLAVEWARDGIRVNAVTPWYIRTPLVQNLLENRQYLDDILTRTPMGRIGEPEEVAALVTWFCLPAASYTTGQVVAVDGGFSVSGF